MRYDERRYDYGLRGFRDTTAPRSVGESRRKRPSLAQREGGGNVRRDETRTPRVTARYNQEYVYGARGAENHPRSQDRFGGERRPRIGDYRSYRQPYGTIGGTRTFRGTVPIRYDGDFGRW